MDIYLYICMYVYMHVYTYMYIHIYVDYVCKDFALDELGSKHKYRGKHL